MILKTTIPGEGEGVKLLPKTGTKQMLKRHMPMLKNANYSSHSYPSDARYDAEMT